MTELVNEPFGPYKDFDDCIAQQKKQGKSDEAARRICGFLQKRLAKGENTENLKFDEKGRLIIAENVQMIFEGSIQQKE